MRVPSCLLAVLAAAPLWAASLAEDVDACLKGLPAIHARDRLAALATRGTVEDRLLVLRLAAAANRASARPALVAAVGDADPVVAVDALTRLAALGPATLAEDRAIRAGLEHRDESVRRAAIGCLASWRERRFAGDLIPRLDGAPEPLRVRLLDALTRISGERLGPNPQAWSDWAATEAAESRARLDSLRQQLGPGVKRPDPGVVAALATVRGRSCEALELLLPLLHHHDREVAAAAVRTLRSLRPAMAQDLDPQLLALAAPPATAAGAQAAGIPGIQAAPEGGSLGSILVVVGVAALAMLGGWVWLGYTQAGRRVVSRTTRHVRRQGGKTLAYLREATGAVVIKLRGRRKPPGPFT